jgi:selenoprotein W-related protein
LTESLLTHYKFDVSGLNLRPGSKGVFDVSLDGELVFSKHKEGRFPEAGEIIEAIDARRASRKS